MRRFTRGLAVVLVVLLGHLVGPVEPAGAVTPASVTLTGSLQSELGCPGDFAPDCAATHLTREPVAPIWSAEFPVPAGSFGYKMALNDSFAENYGAGGAPNGPNIPLSLAAAANVRFYFDEETHWIADSENDVIATVVGSFQSELGCPADFAPDCLLSLLEDLDGDGVSTLVTTALPAGPYEAKVAHDESFTENYGAGGVPGGANIPFTVPAAGSTTTFLYIEATHVLVITSCPPPPRGWPPLGPGASTCPSVGPPLPPPPPPPAICNHLAVTVDLGRGQAPTNGPDVIRGTSGPDIINALRGDDVICSLGGDDIVSGNQGQDRMFGGAGADEMRGNAEGDILRGRAGDDTLYGQAGNDLLDGGADTDVCRAGTEYDTAFGCETTVGVP